MKWIAFLLVSGIVLHAAKSRVQGGCDVEETIAMLQDSRLKRMYAPEYREAIRRVHICSFQGNRVIAILIDLLDYEWPIDPEYDLELERYPAVGILGSIGKSAVPAIFEAIGHDQTSDDTFIKNATLAYFWIWRDDFDGGLKPLELEIRDAALDPERVENLRSAKAYYESYLRRISRR